MRARCGILNESCIATLEPRRSYNQRAMNGLCHPTLANCPHRYRHGCPQLSRAVELRGSTNQCRITESIQGTAQRGGGHPSRTGTIAVR
jgi:hypothetical protein